MSSTRLLRGRLRRNRLSVPVGDDRGSIALLLLVILIGVALGALLVPMIVTQDRASRFDSTRVQALDAAQAGIDVMLSNIRLITTGDASKLPCPTTPITGSANLPATSSANGVAAMYSVSVAYYTSDPLQVAPPATTPPPAMTCASGFLAGAATPSYAQLTSTGTVPPVANGSTSGRTLKSTYQFLTDNSTGGTIQIFPASTGSAALCMDAGPGVTPMGYLVLLQPCTTVNPPVTRQVFTYRNDLTIQLVSSVTAGNPNGLCLTPVVGGAISLSTCQAPGTAPPYTQQWSYNQYGEYQTAVATSTTDGVLGSQCINATSQAAAGFQLALAPCNSTWSDPAQTWTNSAGVGLGAAALPQWANYAESGRCIYIPSATDRVWSYPCTQDPWAGAVPKAQSFTLSTGASGTLTSAAGTCLTAPANAGLVVATTCGAGTPQAWTVNSGATSSYASKYTITNGGLCLGLSAAPLTGDRWSAIQTETCTGAPDQKWNVPPNALTVTLQNVEK